MRGRSFGPLAGTYDRVRPTYPDAALDWLLPGVHRVLDLGAGTGTLTRQLLDRGHEVVAVEPLSEMRAVLASSAPRADVRAGSAEDIPLPDEDVDTCLVGQAWHWFDKGRAVPEVARVLRPGGVLGLLWNARDVSVGWVADLWRIWNGEDTSSQIGSYVDEDQADLVRWFEEFEHRDFPHGQEMDLPTLIDLVSTRSYVIVLPEDERAAMLDRVRDMARTHPDLTGRETFTMPYVTGCWRALRSGEPGFGRRPDAARSR